MRGRMEGSGSNPSKWFLWSKKKNKLLINSVTYKKKCADVTFGPEEEKIFFSLILNTLWCNFNKKKRTTALMTMWVQTQINFARTEVVI